MKKKLFRRIKPFLFVVQLGLVSYLLLSSTESSAQSNWEVGARFGHHISVDMTIPLAAAPRLHPAIYFDRFGEGVKFVKANRPIEYTPN